MAKSKFNKRRLLAGAAAVPFAIAAGLPAYAQSNETTEQVEEVVVSGIRQSIRNAIELKRVETSIVEAISAEDIGKLPDISIAESIARLPGLAAQRLRGRAQVISVRGLGPDFTTALLNGREQVTAGDNRGVEFDQYPSELLSQVVIYKTPDAALVGQGLAGTADLRTIRPLKYGKQTFALNARYEWNGEGALNAGTDDTGYRLTGSYIDQFADDTIGIVIGVSTQSSPTQSERWDAWGYPDFDGNLGLGGAKPYVESRELERDAYLGTIEFAPNDKTNITGDVFYSEFSDVGLLRGIELPLIWGGAPPLPGYSVENGLITSGTFGGVQGVVRNDKRFREAEVFAAGINIERQINERWTAELDVSTSSVKRDDTDVETYSGTGSGFGTGASDDLGFRLGPGGSFVFQSNLNYSDPNLIMLTDPQGWGQVGFIKVPTTDDELNSIRLNAERDIDAGWVSSVEVGVNYSTRDKSKRSVEAFIDLASPGAANTAMVPTNLLQGTTQLDFLGITSGIVSYDPIALLQSGIYTLRPNTNPDVITKAWDVSEDVTLGYLMFNVNTTWNDKPVLGNFGVQVVNTDQESTGPQAVSGSLASVTSGADFTETLPSLNLSIEIADSTFLRVSAARTLMRARMDQLRASQELSINNSICGFDMTGTPFFDSTAVDVTGGQTCLSANGGSPQLRPYLATAFDLSLEKYFADQGGYVSLAVFQKDLEDFIFGTAKRPVDFTSITTAAFGAAFVAANPLITTGTLEEPINAGGGRIRGFEIAASIPGDLFLPEALDGFGMTASYSFTDSSVQPDPNQPPIDIPGLSKRVGNASLYYEKYGLQARVSYRYRSAFLGEVTGFGANREFREVESEGVYDAQVGYTLQGDGVLGGTTFVLQGYNLTDEEFVTFLNNDPRQLKDFQSYGRTFLFGVNYKF